MLYSVKMRSAQGGAHEEGGRHISGAERIVTAEDVKSIAAEMIERAFSHSRGCADFINIKVEAVEVEQFCKVPLLPIQTGQADTVEEGRNLAVQALVAAGVTRQAAQAGLTALATLPDSMRGAMVLSSFDGSRLDSYAERGIRVSGMDIADNGEYDGLLANLGLENLHVREAVVLASKVQSAPGIIAELCWSDDPDYTTGYVASHRSYLRLPHLKLWGSPAGGRAFFAQPDANLTELIEYLEKQPVLVVPKGGEECKK